ncbi:hypothetical protein OGAPHI_004931 [Ogataea philodendri]|uniref:FAD dependent oxidoreductase domain-containing protein n=2 Tax=Saccharomycotina TaxID=147537 RepID=A0A9P8T314_9ASCO|nr:uncharacterized protein OGAPHI_004931 [Ogataea philodendri]KAH3663530.1 hypothetical protein OGAPHI_004931 [Ogataea philodendri]
MVPDSICIIGAGVFGLSTAIALAKRYPNVKVTVVDRFEPPVQDATSVDTTRCLRVDYKDPVYAKLAKESLEIIKADPDISPFFHQTGMSFVYDGGNDKWADIWINGKISAEKSNSDTPGMMKYYDSPEEVYKSIHTVAKTPTVSHPTWLKGYTNYSNGFIDAERSVKAYYERAKKLPSVNFVFKPVEQLLFASGTNTAEGVLFGDGSLLKADLVIVAAGAWSCKLVDLEGVCFSSAIEVAWFKVTPEEEEQWKNMAITTNLSTGINLFPPYNGEIKCLRRSPGYRNTQAVPHPDPAKDESISISYPRTIIDHPADWIPQDAEDALRHNLAEIMPPLAERPFDRTKLCWLTQTPSANFIIDHHPALQNVVLATGGSAHAWKFVPILGDKVVDLLEDKLDPVLKDMWSYAEKLRPTTDNGSAPRMDGQPQELVSVVRNKPVN